MSSNGTNIMHKKTVEKWPHFVIIGGGKSGTTSIDHYLKQHPEVFMSPVKEPNFFGYELSKDSDFKNDPEELDYYRNSITDKKTYLELFKNAKPNQIRGEVSVSYLYHDNAPQRIKHHIPDAKIIAILRQPAARLYSRFLHLARIDRLPSEKFEDCLDPDQQIWWNRNDLIKEGYIYKHLKRYYELFDPNNIKIFFYEDLVSDPYKLMCELFNFIGVDSSFEPDMSVKLNTSGFIKNKYYNSLFGESKGLVQLARLILPENLYKRLKRNSSINKLKTSLRTKNLYKPNLDLELKQKVTSIYTDDISKLSILLDKDLSHWLM